jgi:hypothetical protein
LKSFLDSVRQHTEPMVTLEDGHRALEIALKILAAIREHGAKIRLEKLHGGAKP